MRSRTFRKGPSKRRRPAATARSQPAATSSRANGRQAKTPRTRSTAASCASFATAVRRDRSEMVPSWCHRLRRAGLTAAQTYQVLSQYPAGIAEKYWPKRLRGEVVRTWPKAVRHEH